MKPFMDENFLLETETARTLYHSHAAHMPIIDYHCHVSPEEIARDIKLENITKAWLGGDHYKWRLIRSGGVDERYITGDASDREKFDKFAQVLPRAIGNPLYHWTHLELKRYFGCDLILNPQNADAIWEICNERLTRDDMSVRGIIRKSNVTVVCTTDDPADSLEWHKIMRDDPSWEVKVLPAFRPDAAIGIEKPGFRDYLRGLSKASGIAIKSIDDLKAALEDRINFFAEMGCVASDHGLNYIPWEENCKEKAGAVFKQALAGELPGQSEADAFKAAMLLFLSEQYAKRGWAMQIHYGVVRGANSRMTAKLGADTGFDCISARDSSGAMYKLLDAMESGGGLPKTVLYSLNPNDDAYLATAIGAFQGPSLPGKLQHGSAWWFNDTKTGMAAQLTNLANLGILGNFIGMLTDSRSFLSYTRHEYFRRILCNLIGGWAENGEYPADMEFLGGLVRDISYNNAMRYFFGG
ncbi:MAG: glucuronate isomerase [Oscillospiraceae bacterium]|nr:glucuronate isomerase [Oscillospiraceae bacterium]